MISLRRLIFGSGEDDPEIEPDGRPWRSGSDEESAYSPERAHAGLLARGRREAEADALRHAEDMLDREFPVGAEARDIADARLAALRVAFVARVAELSEERNACEGEVEGVQSQLAVTEQALIDAGVPATETGLAPLRGSRVPAWVAGCAVAVGGVGGILVARLGASVPVLAGLLVAVVALATLLYVTSNEEIEERRITSLRKNRQAEVEALEDARARLVRAEAAAEGLEKETFAVAEGERAFAKRFVSGYASAVFSSLPAGSLEGGRSLAEQPEPEVELPAWVEALGVEV